MSENFAIFKNYKCTKINIKVSNQNLIARVYENDIKLRYLYGGVAQLVRARDS